MKDVIGTIVSFNPDAELLLANIREITNQVEKLIIYDNASDNTSELKNLINNNDAIELIENKDNLGLPINYNKAAKRASQLGYEWLLIMDQDSVLPSNYIENAKKYMKEEGVAIICPRYRDVNIEPYESEIPYDTNFSYVERCISSGSICKVNTILECGGFDERMFIDYVDFDYCKTVRDKGFKILQLNDSIMEHRVGESQMVSLLGRPQIIYNHSPFRKYYYFRNKIYYARKHGISLRKQGRYYLQYIKHLILVFYEKEDKWKKIRAAFKGMRDGFLMKIDQ